MLIETRSGKLVDVRNMRPEDIDIEDVAASLSKLCRFNGHSSRFYSVAQHCCLLVGLMRIDECSPPEILAGLLHDAPEAYLGDLPGPVKQNLQGVWYAERERAILDMVYERFGLNKQAVNEPLVHRYDLIMLATEKRDVMLSRNVWQNLQVEPSSKLVITSFWHPETAERRFLSLYKELQVEARRGG